ncbi:FAD-binding oxidoreductase [Streptomyces chromofuscus]|uniref:FAD-binding oxidoreductase n=1 Tax=Streptomyces chromofuscus TaxID=42881 RepID=A0A7M2TAX4_STRCW|nr:FAD-binding oxidoreductase [Streptomyces chromofuscus]QOV45856.1 FAD-binding oxidoreductase [Streptomyces chromofuscus]GGT18464.1 oxidoreductase [Streptomyces chromofuscus]
MSSKAHTALVELREDLDGDVFAPWDPGYDQARAVFNAMIDRRPAVIAQCAHEADVVRAVRFARELDLHVAVRGGGHSVAGMGTNDAGLVVDLRRMHGVTVDPASEAVRVEGGATTGDLDRATQPYGLATTCARASTTGVAGCVLGGGSGWLERSCGVAADNLLGVELVTANGDRTHASADENPELFWALHGGGGNFGVVTALTLKLYELPEFALALLRYLPEHAREAIRTFREVIDSGPLEASGAVVCQSGPLAELVPPPAGRPLCCVLLTYAGSEEDLRKVAEPLLALPHESEVLTAVPYADVQRLLDAAPGLRHHWSAECLAGAPDDVVDVFGALADSLPARTDSRLVLFPLGGAVADAPADHQVPYRDAAWAVHAFGSWADPADDERCTGWVRDVRAAVRPWSTGAVPLNFVGDEGRDRVRAGLGPQNMWRLGVVKRRYDPDNVFRFNHNVKPL